MEEQKIAVPITDDIVELKMVIVIDDVDKDIPLASYTVWQAIQSRMTHAVGVDHDPHLWSGYQHDVINELWPGIHKQIMTEIITYLHNSKNVQAHKNNNNNRTPVYHVSHEFNELETELKEIEVNRADTRERIAAVATATAKLATPLGQSELTMVGHPRLKAASSKVCVGGKWEGLKPNRNGYYVCKEAIGTSVGCGYATKRLHSFLSHQGKLNKGKHSDIPGFVGDCKDCDDIYVDPRRFSDHVRRNHNKRFCATCWEYYDGTTREHKKNKHTTTKIPAEIPAKLAESLIVHSEAQAPIFRAEPDLAEPGFDYMEADELALTEPEPEPEPAPAPTGHTRWATTAHKEAAHTDALAAINTILDENTDLRGEIAFMREEMEHLRVENDRLREQEAKFQKISALFSEFK